MLWFLVLFAIMLIVLAVVPLRKRIRVKCDKCKFVFEYKTTRHVTLHRTNHVEDGAPMGRFEIVLWHGIECPRCGEKDKYTLM